MAMGKKTGGRKKGTPNKVTAATTAAIAASGLTPRDFLLETMRRYAVKAAEFEMTEDNSNGSHKERAIATESAIKYRQLASEAAKNAAPYCHPRIAPVESTGIEQRDLSRLTDDELSTLERITRKITVNFEDPWGNEASICKIQGEESH